MKSDFREVGLLKSLFELLAIFWVAAWTIGPLAFSAWWAYQYVWPWTHNLAEGLGDLNPLVKAFVLQIFFSALATLPFTVYLVVFSNEELREFVARTAEYLWEAPFLKFLDRNDKN